MLHWLGETWNVGLFSMPAWLYVFIIAALAVAAGLTVYAYLAARDRWREGDRDMTAAFATADRKGGHHGEYREAPQAGPHDEDDQYPARPQVGRPGSSSRPGAGEIQGGGQNQATASRFSLPFLAWLEADREAHNRAAASIDRVLASNVWAATPWLAGR